MGEVEYSVVPCFWLWRRRRSKRQEDKGSEKSGVISGKINTVYYGDYGMEENIYGDNGFVPMKKQERMLKKAMEERENAIKKKGRLKRREK
ncbi:hypothetical protein C2S52_008511 [Perilla frutescens var. hirtella]|nr:hypothetical protein C2S52_008511 [Perilla frutescens var. hirtella]